MGTVARRKHSGIAIVIVDMKHAAVVACAVLLLASCTSESEPTHADPEPPPAKATATPDPTSTEKAGSDKTTGRTIPIQVWFLRPSPRDSKVEFHELLLHHTEIPATQAVARAAIEELFRGVPDSLAKSDDAYSIVPESTRLLGLTVEDGVATIDLNSEFENSGMGSTGGEPHLAQVVYTLTQFPTVKRVAFEIEGEPVGGKGRAFGGHGIILPRFQTRKTWESMLPPIVVESPYPNQTLDWTFDLFGIANVFEATVSWRLLDPDGEVIKEGFTTATCGTGCWGEFEERISIERFPERRAILQVFESSAEDGSPLNTVEVPLSFR